MDDYEYMRILDEKASMNANPYNVDNRARNLEFLEKYSHLKAKMLSMEDHYYR
eukprot:CAMPEP_0168313578 /NCGR_PEP_ID=MMETSP0210-20121227/2851_1 /TAXON_ID=40633 /ORGANISM="Condylostoma magnum, Strain COL2" /LENGTH=52 /DNA_ID=CAMNT_0008271815 /DNA_START=292 /DNA_END=450 /DNA_ORIENTATION=-